jgi:hypothetical protein
MALFQADLAMPLCLVVRLVRLHGDALPVRRRAEQVTMVQRKSQIKEHES